MCFKNFGTAKIEVGNNFANTVSKFFFSQAMLPLLSEKNPFILFLPVVFSNPILAL